MKKSFGMNWSGLMSRTTGTLATAIGTCVTVVQRMNKPVVLNFHDYMWQSTKCMLQNYSCVVNRRSGFKKHTALFGTQNLLITQQQQQQEQPPLSTSDESV